MARRQTRVSISEIEALRRQLGETASAGGGLPDNVVQKFERLLAIAHDDTRVDEAVPLATELQQYLLDKEADDTKRRRASSVTVRIDDTSLLAALDAFAEQHDAHPSRPEAIRLILVDALTAYGLLPPRSRRN